MTSKYKWNSFIICLICLIIYILLLSSSTSLIKVTSSFRLVSSFPEHNDSIFLYRAYYDNRTGPGRLRILAISTCLSDAIKIFIDHDNYSTSLKYFPVEKRCPWHWATNCKWNAYVFESIPLSINNDTIRIRHGSRERNMKVNVLKRLNNQIQICVPPLYWYDDWPRLILFIELWKKENAFILFYINSISQSVKTVLDYYKKQGIVELIEWPMLPMNGDEDPNKSVYRLSHSLAHNDCVMRSSSLFTSLNDIDEFIFVRNSSLLEFAQKVLENNNEIGSLEFSHTGFFTESNINDTFDGLEKISIRNVEGPSKVLFIPSSTLLLSTHSVNTPVARYHKYKVPTQDAFLLHNRISFGNKSIGDEIDLGERNPFDSSFLSSIRSIRDEIFNGSYPLFTSNVTKEVTKCLSGWKISGCKTPITSCYHSIYPLDQWIFSDPSIQSNYTIL